MENSFSIGLIVFSISAIIVYIIFHHLWIRFGNYIPSSEIKPKESNLYKIDLSWEKLPYRQFDVLSKTLKQEINEIFIFPGIEWKNNVFYSEILFFKNFDCKYFKKIINKRIDPNTLIYFPHNEIKWNSNCYLYEPEEKKMYFPEPNSILIHNKELIWKGDTNINIVLGKKIN